MVETDFKNDFSLTSLFKDEHVLFHISQYCNHEQIRKWTQVCLSLRNFVKIYLPEYFEIDPSKDYYTEWKRYCSNGNVKALQYLVSKQIDFGLTEEELKNVQWEVIEYMIKNSIKDNRKSREYLMNVFFIAAKTGNLKMVEYLFDFVPLMDKDMDPIHTALENASTSGHLNVVQFLIKKGARNDCFFIVSEICRKGQIEILNYLVSEGSPLNRDEYLRDACEAGQLNIVQFFVSQGIDISLRHELLDYALLSGNLELIKYLLSQGLVIENSVYFLKNLYKGCNVEILKFLIYCGLELDIEMGPFHPTNYDSEIQSIIFNDDISIFTFFETPQLLSLHGGKCLLDACEVGNLNLVKHLVSKGVKPIKETPNDIHNNEVSTCLKKAIHHSHYEIVQFLIENNVDPFTTLDEVLETEVLTCQVSFVPYLISKGAKMNWDDTIVFSIKNENLDVLESIFSQGADVNWYNGYLINKASQNGDLERVKFLIAKGAKIENTNALRKAIENGHLNIVKYLLPKVSKKEWQNKDIILRAYVNNNWDVIEYLTQCGLFLNTNPFFVRFENL